MGTPPKTNMTMEPHAFEDDVPPFKNGDFPLPCTGAFLEVWRYSITPKHQHFDLSIQKSVLQDFQELKYLLMEGILVVEIPLFTRF